MKKRAVSGTMLTLLLIGILTLAFGIQPVKSACAANLLPISVVFEAENYNLASLPSIDWTHYHNYSEMVTILLALNDTYPNVVDVFSIGKSWFNRDIYCVRLTNESDHKPKPEVFFVGYHHAREQITSELTLYFVVYAATNFGLKATITELINKSEIYVVAALNVDGFDLFEVNDWQRKNARPTDEDSDGLIDEDPPEDENGNGFIDQLIDYTDPQHPRFIRWEGVDNDGDGNYAEDWMGGVDLNRNYDFAWEGGVTSPRSELYRGPAPFSEPETKAVRDFVLQHNFMYAIDFHSGTEFILHPWGTTFDPPPDEAKFIEIARDLSDLTGGTPYMQASHLYITHGAWGDWMYGVERTFALTCEIFSSETWEGVTEPGPDPNTVWHGGMRYCFNPLPQNIESVVLRWLPVFFYITNRTTNEAPSVVTATADIHPRALNLRSKGEWIAAYIELPESYYVGDIDISTVMLNDTIPVSLLDAPAPEPIPSEIGDYDKDGIPDLMVKFNRESVIECIAAKITSEIPRFSYATLTVSGELNDGTPFEGSDTIKVIWIDPTLKHKPI